MATLFGKSVFPKATPFLLPRSDVGGTELLVVVRRRLALLVTRLEGADGVDARRHLARRVVEATTEIHRFARGLGAVWIEDALHVYAGRRPDSAVVAWRGSTPARDDVCVTVRDPRGPLRAGVFQPRPHDSDERGVPPLGNRPSELGRRGLNGPFRVARGSVKIPGQAGADLGAGPRRRVASSDDSRLRVYEDCGICFGRGLPIVTPIHELGRPERRDYFQLVVLDAYG